MRKIFLLTALALLCLVVFLACQKDISGIEPTEPPPDTSVIEVPPPVEKLVKTTILGRVRKLGGFGQGGFGHSLEAIKVTAGGQSTFCDKLGRFRLRDVSVSDEFAFITIEDQNFGGIRYFKTVMTSPSHYVDIILPFRSYTNFQSDAATAKADLEHGFTLAFDNTSFIKEDSTAYIGEIYAPVQIIPLDIQLLRQANNPTFSYIIPGDLRGIDKGGKVKGLKSYGVFRFSLQPIRSSSKLLLGSSNKATASVRIPDAKLSTAPTTVSLWYLDEATGKWKEDGVANRVGNSYVAEVSHSIYWNFAAPVDMVPLKMRFIDQFGSPVPYCKIDLTDVRDSLFASGMTDTTGFLKLWVPKDATIDVQVFDQCDDLVLNRRLGAFSIATELQNIKVEMPLEKSSVYTGYAFDCKWNPIKDGEITVWLADGVHYWAPIKDGKYSINVSRCREAITPYAYLRIKDFSTGLESVEVKSIVHEGVFAMTHLDACGPTGGQFLKFKLDTDSFDLRFAPDTLTYRYENGKTNLWFTRISGQGIGFSIRLPDTAVLNYQQEAQLRVDPNQYFVHNMQVKVTKFGRVNDWIEAEFSGTATKQYQGTVGKAFSGSFRVRRRH